MRYSNSVVAVVFVVAYKKQVMISRVVAAAMDLFCFHRGRSLPEMYVFCDL